MQLATIKISLGPLALRHKVSPVLLNINLSDTLILQCQTNNVYEIIPKSIISFGYNQPYTLILITITNTYHYSGYHCNNSSEKKNIISVTITYAIPDFHPYIVKNTISI